MLKCLLQVTYKVWLVCESCNFIQCRLQAKGSRLSSFFPMF